MNYRLRKARKKLYLALEDLNFDWEIDEIIQFQEYWFYGFSLEWLAERFNRDLDEMALLVIDLSFFKHISPRKYGLKTSPRMPLDKRTSKRLLNSINKDNISSYTVLEEFNFCWDIYEVYQFRQLWAQGKSLQKIADFFNREQVEIILLIIDQARKSLIKERLFGLYGKGSEINNIVTKSRTLTRRELLEIS